LLYFKNIGAQGGSSGLLYGKLIFSFYIIEFNKEKENIFDISVAHFKSLR
jgi:hypothetical protein